MTEAWKFGDLIENGWASDSNPTRIGYFVRRGHSNAFVNRGAYIELTDGSGKFWRVSPKGEHRLRKVGQSNLATVPNGGSVALFRTEERA